MLRSLQNYKYHDTAQQQKSESGHRPSQLWSNYQQLKKNWINNNKSNESWLFVQPLSTTLI